MNKYLLYWNIEYNMLTREKLATILVLLFSASLQGCCKKYEHLNIKKKTILYIYGSLGGIPSRKSNMVCWACHVCSVMTLSKCCGQTASTWQLKVQNTSILKTQRPKLSKGHDQVWIQFVGQSARPSNVVSGKIKDVDHQNEATKDQPQRQACGRIMKLAPSWVPSGNQTWHWKIIHV
jgi:hypothetical protein